MSKYQVYSLDNIELQKYLNHAYINTMIALTKEGFITDEQCNTLCQHYAVIIEETSWVPEKLAKWMGLKKDRMTFSLAKVISRGKGNIASDESSN